ncbi:MAG: hypothetical protein RLY86_3094 [Pseudomonadota bacterium]|jgi:regulator of sigma E protease
MELLGFAWNYVIVFLAVLTILVFVHELGHYWVARRAGVKVEVFSIGFGPEIFGWHDRSGTRWRFSAIPLGGYVRMFGDADAASRPDHAANARMDDLARSQSFFHKPLRARAAVIAAGPAANFAFAIVALAILFMVYGQTRTNPVVQTVQPDSAAAEAGVLPGDRVVTLNGTEVDRFERVVRHVLTYPGEPMDWEVERDGERIALTVSPRVITRTDRFGNEHTTGFMGVTYGPAQSVRLGPVEATAEAVAETWNLTTGILANVWQLIIGVRDTDELGGPLRIAQMSGDMAQISFGALLWFMAVMSVNLGLINLFPIPMLDGGHLLYYGIEAVRGRPLSERAQEYGFRIGLALVLTLMVFVTWNDIVQFGVVRFFVDLIS